MEMTHVLTTRGSKYTLTTTFWLKGKRLKKVSNSVVWHDNTEFMFQCCLHGTKDTPPDCSKRNCDSQVNLVWVFKLLKCNRTCWSTMTHSFQICKILRIQPWPGTQCMGFTSFAFRATSLSLRLERVSAVSTLKNLHKGHLGTCVCFLYTCMDF